jgi:hypothetical protein
MLSFLVFFTTLWLYRICNLATFFKFKEQSDIQYQGSINLEQVELSYTVGRRKNWYNQMENCLVVSKLTMCKFNGLVILH